MELDSAEYGEHMAEVYDDWYQPGDVDACVTALADLAGDGPALELGIGTGRVALPLAARDLVLHGLDASPAMVERLRAKPGGSKISVAIGDFADFKLGVDFSLVFVVFNTFFALSSQDRQVSCMAAVSRHLAPGGRFVMESFVPDPARFDDGKTVASVVKPGAVRINVHRHDPVAQRVMTQRVAISEAGIRLYPAEMRYAWPAELDLMARLAGLELEARWAGWRREPFGAGSPGHVSVWRKP